MRTNYVAIFLRIYSNSFDTWVLIVVKDFSKFTFINFKINTGVFSFETGYENIVCAQPFGCLPNHIAGKGVVNRIRAKYPNANITAVDYDPSATKVNQENRIKLMLSVAKERLNQKNKSTE